MLRHGQVQPHRVRQDRIAVYDSVHRGDERPRAGPRVQDSDAVRRRRRGRGGGPEAQLYGDRGGGVRGGAGDGDGAGVCLSERGVKHYI